jgi:hypothetical protein
MAVLTPALTTKPGLCPGLVVNAGVNAGVNAAQRHANLALLSLRVNTPPFYKKGGPRYGCLIAS